MQDDDRAPLGVQATECAVQEFPIHDDRRDVGDGGPVEGRELDLYRPTTLSSQAVNAGANDQATEPRLKPIRIAKRRKVPPSSNEPLLDRVSRELVIPEDESGRRVQARDERAGKQCEGVMIAALCPLDELSLVHGDPSGDGAASMSRSDGMSPRFAKGFPGFRADARLCEPRGSESIDRDRRRAGEGQVRQDLPDRRRELEPVP